MPTVIISNNTGADFSGTDDARIFEWSIQAGTNYGSDTTAEVHALDPGAPENSSLLVKFPGLSNIVGPVTVTAATLELYMSDNFFGVEGNIDLRRVLRNWVEAEASGNNYSTGNAWTTLGAKSLGNDVASSATQTGVFVSSTDGQWISFSNANLIADVQGFINGTFSNYGWALFADTADPPTATFITSEGTDSFRPRLTVTYTASGGGGGDVVVPAAPAQRNRRKSGRFL